MRITRENIAEFRETAEALKDELDSVLEAAETWDDLQDGERNADTAEEIRSAREELESGLDNLDVATLCQLIHGKHSKVIARNK